MKKFLFLLIPLSLMTNDLLSSEKKEENVDWLIKHRMSRFERIPTWSYREDNDSYVIGSDWKEFMLGYEVKFHILKRVREEKEMVKKTKRIYLNYDVLEEKDLS